jgi:hypothetical protein
MAGLEDLSDRELLEMKAREMAPRYGVDPDFAATLFHEESGFDPKALSKAGALGVGQLMPATAERFGLSAAERANPVANIETSLKYLQTLHERYGGDRIKVVTAYNAGEGKADAGTPLADETVQLLTRMDARHPGILTMPRKLAAEATTRQLEQMAGPGAPPSPLVSPQTTGERLYDIATDPRGIGMTAGALVGGPVGPVLGAALGGAAGQGALELQQRGGQPAGRTGLDPGLLARGLRTIQPQAMLGGIGQTMQGNPPEVMERMAWSGVMGALTEGGAQVLSRFAASRLSPRAEQAQRMFGKDTPLTMRQAFPSRPTIYERRMAEMGQQLGVIPPMSGPQYEALTAKVGQEPVDLMPVQAWGKVLRANREPIAGHTALADRLDKMDNTVTFSQAQDLVSDLTAASAQVSKDGYATKVAASYGEAKEVVLDAMEQTLRVSGDPSALTEFQAAREATKTFYDQAAIARLLAKHADPKRTLRGPNGSEVPVYNGETLFKAVQAGETKGRFRRMEPDRLARFKAFAEASALGRTQGADPALRIANAIAKVGLSATPLILRVAKGEYPTMGEAGLVFGAIIVPKIWARLIDNPAVVRAAMVYAQNPRIAAMATGALERLTMQAADNVLRDMDPTLQVMPRVPKAPTIPRPLGPTSVPVVAAAVAPRAASRR